ncbi:MAG: phospholipid carrier-dependent glycosyltransferase, partial [Candidatus Neomarinimicrobiota bacterium]
MKTPLKQYNLEICFILILIFTVILKLPSLSFPHNETDERIYVTLAKQMYNTGTYTLQNTAILKDLSPEMYDRPLFLQPPMYIILSIPLILNFGDNYAVIISWLGHILVLLSIFLFSRKLFKENHFAILLIVVLAATDPIMVFASRKIWLDSLVAGFVGLSMFAFWKASLEENQRKKIKYFIFSGILLGSGIVTKVTAVLMVPFFMLIFIKYHYRLPIKRNIILLLASFVPVLVVIFPWFLQTYLCSGKLIDIVDALPEKLLETNKYLQMVTNRPIYYYFTEIILLTPVILFPLHSSIRNVKKISFYALTFWISLFSVIVGNIYFAFTHHDGYVMRRLTLTCVPFYLLLGLYLQNMIQSTNLITDQEISHNINIYKYT